MKAPIQFTHTKAQDSLSVAGGYLLKTFAPYYYTKRLFGAYYVYNKADGFIAVASTMRQVRNAMRGYSYKGIKTIEGIE